MNRRGEIAHKMAVFAAWRAHPLRLPAHEPTPPLLVSQVVRLVRQELKEAERFHRDQFDLAQGRLWWRRFEGAVDVALLDTLKPSVRRGDAESPQDYLDRLRAIASRFATLTSPTARARLSDNGPIYYAGTPARSGKHPFGSRQETRRRRGGD